MTSFEVLVEGQYWSMITCASRSRFGSHLHVAIFTVISLEAVRPRQARGPSSHSSLVATIHTITSLSSHPPHFRKMYIGAVAAAQISSNSNEFANILLEQDKDHLEWFANAIRVSCTGFLYY